MKLIKYKQKNTYVGKDGKEKHYYGYALIFDNGSHVGIKCLSDKDYAMLNAVAEYVTRTDK